MYLKIINQSIKWKNSKTAQKSKTLPKIVKSLTELCMYIVLTLKSLGSKQSVLECQTYMKGKCMSLPTGIDCQGLLDLVEGGGAPFRGSHGMAWIFLLSVNTSDITSSCVYRQSSFPRVQRGFIRKELVWRTKWHGVPFREQLQVGRVHECIRTHCVGEGDCTVLSVWLTCSIDRNTVGAWERGHSARGMQIHIDLRSGGASEGSICTLFSLLAYGKGLWQMHVDLRSGGAWGHYWGYTHVFCCTMQARISTLWWVFLDESPSAPRDAPEVWNSWAQREHALTQPYTKLQRIQVPWKIAAPMPVHRNGSHVVFTWKQRWLAWLLWVQQHTPLELHKQR